MFLTEEQLAARLASPRNLANRFSNGRQIEIEVCDENQEEPQEREDLHQEGIQFREIKRPGNNRPWLSKEERTRIATDFASSTLDEHKTRTEIAKTYSVTPSTVSDIVNGTRRIEDSSRSVDQSKIDSVLDSVREKAVDRLMTGLGQLTEDKISAHTAKDISAICANMAKVVQQTIPQEKTAQAINLIVYTPEMRKESHFEIVEIG